MRHRVHAGYTLLLPLRAERVKAAAAWLAGAALPFDRCGSTHFATITILDADEYRKQPLPATLLFATSFCGPADAHVDELVQAMGSELRELFANCERFSATHDLAEFITKNRHSDCFYSGMQNISPDDVSRHAKLREVIEQWLGAGNITGTAVKVRARIQEFVRSRDDLKWALEPDRVAPGTWIAMHWRTLTIVATLVPIAGLSIAGLFYHPAIVGAVWLAVVLLVVAVVFSIRLSEDEQTYVSTRQPDEKVRALAATQNRPVINEFVIAGRIKEEGVMRPMVLRAALWLVAWLVQGIPRWRTPMEIPTVATARWIAADRGRRLIFISNYTNAAEAYVRDFIDFPTGARDINISFGFGRGYPKTRWILNGGAATDPNAFAYVVGEHQRPAAYWYRGPNANLSIDNIRLNRQIRAGLVGTLAEREAQEWLHLL